jgi:ABC-type multidrug transport system fused ATPase/permease subunit
MLYGMLAIILFAAYSLKNEHHKIHAHDLVTFIMTVISLMPVLKRILNVNFVWQSGDVSFTKMLSVFNAKQENNNASEEKKITRGSITFNNVSFTFYKGDSVFKNLSFSIPDNSLVLISGEHQSGKSTLFKLIMGLYPANEGEIFVGNNNIDNYSKLFLRKKITVVSDEFPLIGKTVFEAISYSRKEENRMPAFKILQKLNYAKENETESLLDEPIFENGKNLSYSQRKILMFARALLTNKKILLLDEPFEGLDDNLVLILVSILEELKLSNRTILVIDRNRHQQLKYDMNLDLSPQNQ